MPWLPNLRRSQLSAKGALECRLSPLQSRVQAQAVWSLIQKLYLRRASDSGDAKSVNLAIGDCDFGVRKPECAIACIHG